VVRLIPAADEQNGIVLPDAVRDAQAKRRAEVLAVGRHEITSTGEIIPHFFARGDKVVLSMFTQPEQIVEDVFCVRFSEVLALETDESN